MKSKGESRSLLWLPETNAEIGLGVWFFQQTAVTVVHSCMAANMGVSSPCSGIDSLFCLCSSSVNNHSSLHHSFINC